MEKDFDLWTGHKKKAHGANKRASFKEVEVWWCCIGANVGDEEDGKGLYFTRPVLIFKKFNQNIFLGIPLSTQIKESRFYYKLHFKGIEQSALLSQLRIFDAKRLRERMGELPADEFNKLKEKIKQLIL